MTGKAARVPRAARGAACGRGRHVGQHVGGQTARQSNEDFEDNKASQCKR